MVSRKEKSQMSQFLTGRLEESGLYRIISQDNSQISLEIKGDSQQPGIVLLHNKKMTKEELRNKLRDSLCRGIYITNVFYKNDKDFHVRLGSRGYVKGDYRSLKRYTHEERNQMIHLRDLEGMVLEHQSGNRVLVYYQPETERLEEAVVGYQMDDVMLDYSHLEPGDQGYSFSRDGPSLDYKIATERFRVTSGAVAFKTVDRTVSVLHPHQLRQ